MLNKVGFTETETVFQPNVMLKKLITLVFYALFITQLHG